MPSAQRKQFEEPQGLSSDELRTDLNSFLHAIHASNISDLNSLHARGSVLFAEGEPARGVYILRTGRATVSIASSEGRIVMLRLARPGDVLGLNSVLRNCPYDTTVKTLEPCRTDFISRLELIDLMRQSEAGTQAVLNVLSRELTELTDRAKLLLLPQTVRGRLARLLLEWSKANNSDALHPVRLDKVFTHEEIAQMICSSRETVTRLLAHFSKQQVIRITSDSILIRDRDALEKSARG
ncbi:MAG TPA: Crp/Fnr family transcriptional regulator [Pyrinomonadaceae bacterium]